MFVAIISPIFLLHIYGCEDDSCPRSIEIISPLDGASITSADDINPTTPGFQITVLCRVRCVKEETVTLVDQNHDDDTIRYYTRPYDGSGTVDYRGITFQNGPPGAPITNTLYATAGDGSVSGDGTVTSDTVTIHVGD